MIMFALFHFISESGVYVLEWTSVATGFTSE